MNYTTQLELRFERCTGFPAAGAFASGELSCLALLFSLVSFGGIALQLVLAL